MMTLGTKSILIGAHCFFLHPFFVAWAWWKLYGFPFDPRLWCAFFFHDIGYLGKPNIDGPEGKLHPYLGAKIMGYLFDWGGSTRWHDFTLYHSRSIAKMNGQTYSKLCVADKLAMTLEPKRFYLWRVQMTGEVFEYMSNWHVRHGGDPKRWNFDLVRGMSRRTPKLYRRNRSVWYDDIYLSTLRWVWRDAAK